MKGKHQKIEIWKENIKRELRVGENSCECGMWGTKDKALLTRNVLFQLCRKQDYCGEYGLPYVMGQ